MDDEVKYFFNIVKAASVSSVQVKGVVEEVSLVGGVVTRLKSRMNLWQKFAKPRNCCNCFYDVATGHSATAWIFSGATFI